VEQIFLFGRIQITSAAMAYCLQYRIPVYMFSGTGRYYGTLHSLPGNQVYVRKKQYELTLDGKAVSAFAKSIVRGKIQNYKTFILRYARNHTSFDPQKYVKELKQLIVKVENTKTTDRLRGLEGAATASYYRAFSKMVMAPFYFEGRNKRPPIDPVNGMMSFGYTMVYYNLYSYICARNLDPDMGFFHCVTPGHHSLASDLLEEFRASVVDALVLSICNNAVLSPDDFYFGEGNPQPCLMKDDARKTFIQHMEEKLASPVSHPDAGEPVNWRRCIDLQVMRLRRFVEGSVKQYIPYTIR
jgi:CRISPR-associated protein Cas1